MILCDYVLYYFYKILRQIYFIKTWYLLQKQN